MFPQLEPSSLRLLFYFFIFLLEKAGDRWPGIFQFYFCLNYNRSSSMNTGDSDACCGIFDIPCRQHPSHVFIWAQRCYCAHGLDCRSSWSGMLHLLFFFFFYHLIFLIISSFLAKIKSWVIVSIFFLHYSINRAG